MHRFSPRTWLAVALGLLGLAAAWAIEPVTLLAQKAKTQRTGAKPGASDLAMLEAEKGNWSRWRGPNNDGISKEQGLLTEWPKDGPPLVWKASGLGGGFSSVAVVDGRIYTMGSHGGAT